MAALFRPEGEKRPLIGAEETERASGASLMLAWILDWAMKLVSFYIISPDFINMFGRGGGRARIVARSEERPRAALFRPEGEKRPLIWPLERRATAC